MASRRSSGGARGASSTNPVDIAMDAEASGEPLDSPTLRLLAKQEQLIEAEIALARDARFSNRMKAAREIAVAAAVALLVAAAGWMVWDASRADEMVVETWSAPPDFAADGRGGEVLASTLADVIQRMQKAAEVEATGIGKKAGGPSTELSLEIPQTGVSIGELQRWLRRTLGHQTVVSGRVVRLLDGQRIGVSVRVGDQPAVTFAGPREDLAKMMTQAAEAALKQSDPLRYAGFLIASRRLDEAAAVVEPLAYRGTPRERANALTNLVNIRNYQNREAEALALARKAIALDPDNLSALGYLASAEYNAGHEEQALVAARRLVKGLRRPGAGAALGEFMRLENEPLWPMLTAAHTGDFAAALPGYDQLADVGRGFGSEYRARYWMGEKVAAQIAAHDLAGARATADLLVAPRPQAQFETLAARRNQALAADALGRHDQALHWARQTVAYVSQVQGVSRRQWLAVEASRLAEVMARSGDPAGARALLADAPADCVPCLRALGVVAGHERKWAEADRLFAAATRLAPSSPFAWSAWGQSKLARGDAAGAQTLLDTAQKAGPGWADPLKYEGDALMRQGKPAAAAKRYAAAAERAPQWGALHLAWGDALARAGRKDEAVTQWQAALGCGMSMADWRAAKARLGKTT